METDSKLKHDVSAVLQLEASVTSKSIGVDVHHGAVTLTGKVASYSEQRNAGRAALRVWGVANLKNEIKVALPGDLHSWQERKLALHAAWGSPGIGNVEDKMLLAA